MTRFPGRERPSDGRTGDPGPVLPPAPESPSDRCNDESPYNMRPDRGYAIVGVMTRAHTDDRPTNRAARTGLQLLIAALLVAGGWVAHSAFTTTPVPTHTPNQPGIIVPGVQPEKDVPNAI